MTDRIPHRPEVSQDFQPWIRRMLLVLISILTSWGITTVVPFLTHQGGAGALVGILLALLLAAVTPLEASWGLNTDAAVNNRRLARLRAGQEPGQPK